MQRRREPRNDAGRTLSAGTLHRSSLTSRVARFFRRDFAIGKIMKPFRYYVWLLVVTLLSLSQPSVSESPRGDADVLAEALSKAAPIANPAVVDLAVAALQCAVGKGTAQPARLAVIDYSLPSTQPRLWVFDVAKRRLLHQELVAHGKNTGENYAQRFSNRLGSLQSSLGLFRTRNAYNGAHGYSLRMDGMENGINDRAFERAIVIHGAPYVDAGFAQQHGRIGRSWGCPAVRAGIAREIVDALKNGQFVFAYYPDQQWLAKSSYLNCATPTAAHLLGTNASKNISG